MTQPKKYRPSNGTEGELFEDAFCSNCKHNDNCDIVFRTMSFDVDDDEYPNEWIYDKDNKPRCVNYVLFEMSDDDLIAKWNNFFASVSK